MIKPPVNDEQVITWRRWVAYVLNGVVAATSFLASVAKFGSQTSYTEFESDGTLKFVGSATVWRDQLGPLIGQRLESPSSGIIQNNAEASLTFKTSANLTDYIIMPVQVNHDWLMGSNLVPHIHWWQTSSSVPNWLLQHRWQKNGQSKNITWISVPRSTNAFTYTSGTLNQITTFGQIAPPTGYGISDVWQLRLIRDNANASGLFAGADPVATSIDAMSFDVHVEVDTVGSRTEFTK